MTKIARFANPGLAVALALVCSFAPRAAPAVAPSRAETLEESVRAQATRLGIADRAKALAAGEVVAWELETSNDSEVAATAAVVVDATVDQLVAEIRDLELLRKRGVLTAHGRFSEEAKLSDLDGLTVPATTLDAMAKAKYRSSEIKLSSAEINAARRAKPEARAALFKGFLYRRLLGWRQRGVEGLGFYHDKRWPVNQTKTNTELLAALAKSKPPGTLPLETRFQYWSVEQYGSLKAVIAITDLSVTHGERAARIETIQIYSNHYFEGLVTALDFADVGTEQTPATLVRLTFHSRLDIFDGLLAGLKRRLGRSRTVDELADNFKRLRDSYRTPAAPATPSTAPAPSAIP